LNKQTKEHNRSNAMLCPNPEMNKQLYWCAYQECPYYLGTRKYEDMIPVRAFWRCSWFEKRK
jgi:hypothetical protein